MGDDGVDMSAHDAKALMRGLAQVDLVFSHLQLDTAIAAYLVDPAGDQYLLEDLALRYAGLELRGPDGPPPGQLDLSGTGLDAAGEAARRAAAVARLVEPLSAALAARGMSRLYDEVERPLVRVLAKMEELGRPGRRGPAAPPGRRAGVGGPPAGGGDPGPGRDPVRGQLHPAAARDPVQQARPDTAEADQDRLLDRRPDAGEAARRAPDHRRPPALPGGREAAVHLRRVAAGRGGSGRADPRHLQPDRGPHRPAELRSAQPAQHPGPQRGGPAVPVLLPAGGGLPLPGGGLQPDRAAGHRPPGRGSRADRGLHGRDRHPQRHRRPHLRGRTART